MSYPTAWGQFHWPDFMIHHLAPPSGAPSCEIESIPLISLFNSADEGKELLSQFSDFKKDESYVITLTKSMRLSVRGAPAPSQKQFDKAVIIVFPEQSGIILLFGPSENGPLRSLLFPFQAATEQAPQPKSTLNLQPQADWFSLNLLTQKVLASNVDEESAKEQAGRIMDLLFDSRVVKKPACKPDLGIYFASRRNEKVRLLCIPVPTGTFAIQLRGEDSRFSIHYPELVRNVLMFLSPSHEVAKNALLDLARAPTPFPQPFPFLNKEPVKFEKPITKVIPSVQLESKKDYKHDHQHNSAFKALVDAANAEKYKLEISESKPKPLKRARDEDSGNTNTVSEAIPVPRLKLKLSQPSPSLPPTPSTPSSQKRRRYSNTQSNTPLCCEFCSTEQSPEWRKGPSGQKTLCNACGLKYSRRIAKMNKKANKLTPVTPVTPTAVSNAGPTKAISDTSIVEQPEYPMNGSPGQTEGHIISSSSTSMAEQQKYYSDTVSEGPMKGSSSTSIAEQRKYYSNTVSEGPMKGFPLMPIVEQQKYHWSTFAQASGPMKTFPLTHIAEQRKYYSNAVPKSPMKGFPLTPIAEQKTYYSSSTPTAETASHLTPSQNPGEQATTLVVPSTLGSPVSHGTKPKLHPIVTRMAYAPYPAVRSPVILLPKQVYRPAPTGRLRKLMPAAKPPTSAALERNVRRSW